MYMKNLLWPILALLAFAATSCSNDDDTPSDPQGTVALNMLDESNGKTMLENSGIYIDKAQNFVTGSDCYLFPLGKASGLGAARVKAMSNPVSRAAVEAGTVFVAARPGALMEFPSGAKALKIKDSRVNYIKYYVISSLKEGDKTIGAAVKYAILTPETYGLPDPESIALTIDLRNYNYDDKVALTLSDSDFEYDFHGDNNVACVKKGRKLLFSVEGYVNSEYTLYLRIRESYTKVYVRVEG